MTTTERARANQRAAAQRIAARRKADLAKWPCRRKGYCANHPNKAAMVEQPKAGTR